jgi:hypothetical protein
MPALRLIAVFFLVCLIVACVSTIRVVDMHMEPHMPSGSSSAQSFKFEVYSKLPPVQSMPSRALQVVARGALRCCFRVLVYVCMDGR